MNGKAHSNWDALGRELGVRGNDRDAKMTVLLGYNGTGKTTFLTKLLLALQQKVLVVTPHDREWNEFPDNELKKGSDYAFKGIQRHIYDVDTLDKISRFTKGILVFDDCRAYFNDKPDEQVRRLLISRRQREVDIFAVAHGFTQMPPLFFTFASEIILFRTVDNIDRRKNCINDFEKVKALQIEVNKLALKNPHVKKIIKY